MVSRYQLLSNLNACATPQSAIIPCSGFKTNVSFRLLYPASIKMPLHSSIRWRACSIATACIQRLGRHVRVLVSSVEVDEVHFFPLYGIPDEVVLDVDAPCPPFGSYGVIGQL